MNCTRAEELIHDLVDGTLADEQCESVERHCAACASCAALLAEFRTLGDLMADMPDIEPPTERMWTALSSRLGEEPSVVTDDEPGWFTGLTLALRGHWRVLAPSLTVAIVLIGIMPLWTVDQPGPFYPAARLEATLVDTSEAYRIDVTADLMAEASSEARLDMLDKAFSDARLDMFTADDYDDWAPAASMEQDSQPADR